MFGQLNDSDDDIFGQSGADLNNLVAAQQDLAVMQKRPSRAVDTQLGLDLKHKPQNNKLSQRFEFRESMVDSGKKNVVKEESSDSENYN